MAYKRLSFQEVYERIYPVRLHISQDDMQNEGASEHIPHFKEVADYFSHMAAIVGEMEQTILDAFPKNKSRADHECANLYAQLLRVADQFLWQEMSLFSDQSLMLASIVFMKSGDETAAIKIFNQFDEQAELEISQYNIHIEKFTNERNAAVKGTPAYQGAQANLEEEMKEYTDFVVDITSSIFRATALVPASVDAQNIFYLKGVNVLDWMMNEGVRYYHDMIASCAEAIRNPDKFPSALLIVKDSYEALIDRNDDETQARLKAGQTQDIWDQTVDMLHLGLDIIAQFPDVTALTGTARHAIREHYSMLKSIDAKAVKEELAAIEEAYMMQPDHDKTRRGIEKVLKIIGNFSSENTPKRPEYRRARHRQVQQAAFLDQWQPPVAHLN